MKVSGCSLNPCQQRRISISPRIIRNGKESSAIRDDEKQEEGNKERNFDYSTNCCRDSGGELSR
ncbi:MAG TPA: hypothetical protein VKA09_16630, partial [Nitrososphaeraceae archaeon]|nr:hypothetical protein [Nitrososphaeraceae archaeon]